MFISYKIVDSHELNLSLVLKLTIQTCAFISLDPSLFCPTSVIVTANVSQEKSIDNCNNKDEKYYKIGKN